jgi:hypothetical protein
MPNPTIRVLTTEGLQFLQVSDHDASLVGAHWNAVRRYLDTGDHTALTHSQGVTVDGHVLETDPETIEWLAIRGDVRFESIYNEVV